jgi:hypothetical protein
LDWTVFLIHHKVKIWPVKLHLFHPVKKAIHEDQFRENGELIKEAKMWFWHAPQNFNSKGYRLFFPEGKKPYRKMECL